MSKSLLHSLSIHAIVFLLFAIDLPFFSWNKSSELKQIPIIIDLKDIKISELTNLPPKAIKGDEDKDASSIKRKVEEKFTTDEPKETAPKPEVKEEKKEEPQPKEEKEEAQPKEPTKDFLAAPPSQKPKVMPKPNKKPTPPAPAKKPEAPKKDNKKTNEKKTAELANPLKSLLSSLDDLEKNIGEKNQAATLKNTDGVNNMGIEGGTGGSYFSELSISEIDAIAGRLRGCWNLDPGARGIRDMVVEIRAELNKDGTVRDVRIMDTSRYNSDPHFRSVADSARRAVHICAPYQIFAEKYQEKYDIWKTLKLRFNPMDGGIN